MKHITAVLAFIALAVSGAAFAQSTAAGEAPQAQTPKVYHAGGRHDRAAHEAALRAKAEGTLMKEPKMHAGGRHDMQSHQAALRAQGAQTAGDSATRPAD
jgi:hypothetical protein